MNANHRAPGAAVVPSARTGVDAPGDRAVASPAGPGAAVPPAGAVLTTDRRELRSAFGTFATGVTVMTVAGVVPHGMTANSFTSVSLDPPLVLVCVDRAAFMHDSVLAEGAFAVSVLAAHQEHIARHFADPRRGKGMEEFEPVPWLPGDHTGAALIRGALAWFECGLQEAYDGGDHSIFLGRLMSARRQEDTGALLFFGGQFSQFTKEGQ